MKTIKQFIKELQKLDQDKPIWVYYDSYYAFEPEVNKVLEDDYTSEDSERMNKDDYKIMAW